MKTNAYLLVLLLLLLVAGLQSQTLTQVKLGVIGGLNFANFSGDDIEDLDDEGFDIEGRTLGHIGIIGNATVLQNLSLQGEIAFSMNGSKWEANFCDEYEVYDATWTHSINMLQIPVSAIYTLNLPELAIKPYLGAGISASIPVSSGLSVELGGQDEDFDYDDDDYIELSSFVLGYQLNLGMEYKRYFCEIRYERSITPVFDDKYVDDVFYKNLKLLVGFRFDSNF
ncbi:MAG TPA: outer membrane beta-barrel protein [Candidatus Cloacimonas acidaminovorans]|nr:outer membrane beta-barrel protein [Candidatus Cloacimonas acidaminovorans]